MKFIYLLPLLAIFGFSNVHAGVYSDALGKCFIDSTSSKDRNILIVWIFSAASQHPVVRDILTVSEEKLESANRDFAELTMKLLTVDCKTETEKRLNMRAKKL